MMGPVVHSDLWAQSMREFSFHFTVMVGISTKDRNKVQITTDRYNETSLQYCF